MNVPKSDRPLAAVPDGVPDTVPESAEAEAQAGGEEAAASSSYLVPGLERGLRILGLFSARESVLGAPEISRRIGIPRTTTFRLLQTLEALGFVERVQGDRAFRLSVAVLRLGFEYLSSLELTDLGVPILERLRDQTECSAHLVIRDQRDVVFVAKAQTLDPRFGSVKVHVGTRMPAHATIHGQVLLGDLSVDALRQLYPDRHLEAFTDRTPSNFDALYDRVRQCVRQGYGVSEGAFERGISVVTAPVRDHTRGIVAAITVTVPRAEIGAPAERELLIQRVCTAAIDLSERLSYSPTIDDPTALCASKGSTNPL